ncbi:hypothetical protein HPB49_004985 [Dermacentor silvarum]|uniref:Uncharacterized protein n=1 Tax=Dermacentor silvarum TaxID=543639 RepID=A0ACB8CVF2_DERSI|nr:hypothetical protein HPB49_004985 [Dermacentor silvarum]
MPCCSCPGNFILRWRSNDVKGTVSVSVLAEGAQEASISLLRPFSVSLLLPSGSHLQRSHGRRHRKHLHSQAIQEATTIAVPPEAMARPVASATGPAPLLPPRPPWCCQHLHLPSQVPHLPSRRHVATWAFQSGSEVPVCFVSVRRCKEQRKVESGMSKREIPHVFRGCTVSAMVEPSGGAVMAPDPSAVYCEVCGVLRLCRAHDASKVHKVYVKKMEPAAGESGTDPVAQVPKKMDPDVKPALLCSVVGALASGLAFAATIAAAVQQATALVPLHSSALSLLSGDTDPPGESLDFDIFG